MPATRRIFLLVIASSLGALASIALAAGCGARTGLRGELTDGSVDVSVDNMDAHHADVATDALEDPIDDIVFPDVPIVTTCVDAGTTYVYVITEQNELYSFYPPTLGFTKIGNIQCKSSAKPFSMGVDRSGIAYSVFNDGNLFQISTLNAACKATPYVPGQHTFTTFGMGYSGAADAGETLYVSQTSSSNPTLGSIDTTSYELSVIGTYHPSKGGRCELTGTGDGRLFAFCLPVVGNGGALVELDPATAQVLSDVGLPFGGSQDAFAYAFWGGDFWMFTGQTATTVTRYDPVAQTSTTVATFASTIVGAGVSTCAPE